MNVQVAKDYSQPEVRRQQDEDKRLRLQVRSVWDLGEIFMRYLLYLGEIYLRSN